MKLEKYIFLKSCMIGLVIGSIFGLTTDTAFSAYLFRMGIITSRDMLILYSSLFGLFLGLIFVILSLRIFSYNKFSNIKLGFNGFITVFIFMYLTGAVSWYEGNVHLGCWGFEGVRHCYGILDFIVTLVVLTILSISGFVIGFIISLLVDLIINEKIKKDKK